MSRAKTYPGPDFRKPEERAAAVRGLTERQARLGAAAIDRDRWLLPNYGLVPQVDDQLREAK